MTGRRFTAIRIRYGSLALATTLVFVTSSAAFAAGEGKEAVMVGRKTTGAAGKQGQGQKADGQKGKAGGCAGKQNDAGKQKAGDKQNGAGNGTVAVVTPQNRRAAGRRPGQQGPQQSLVRPRNAGSGQLARGNRNQTGRQRQSGQRARGGRQQGRRQR